MKEKPAPSPAAPNLEGWDLTPRTFGDLHLEDDATFEALQLTGIAAGSAANTRWTACSLQSARLSGATWTQAHWEDLVFENCDLANLQAQRAYAVRAVLSDCRLVGFQSVESNWRDIVFRNCNASLMNFSGARFERVRFEKCDLSRSDFTDCDLRGVVFRNCQLKEADFTGARLDKTDWRGCEIQPVRLGVRDMKGLIVSESQAAYFARLLGLKVLAEPEEEDRP